MMNLKFTLFPSASLSSTFYPKLGGSMSPCAHPATLIEEFQSRPDLMLSIGTNVWPEIIGHEKKDILGPWRSRARRGWEWVGTSPRGDLSTRFDSASL